MNNFKDFQHGLGTEISAEKFIDFLESFSLDGCNLMLDDSLVTVESGVLSNADVFLTQDRITDVYFHGGCFTFKELSKFNEDKVWHILRLMKFVSFE